MRSETIKFLEDFYDVCKKHGIKEMFVGDDGKITCVVNNSIQYKVAFDRYTGSFSNISEEYNLYHPGIFRQ